MNLKEIIADYQDFPKKGILFRDFSPILKNPAAMEFIVDEFSKKFHPNDVDVFVGIESRGMAGTGGGASFGDTATTHLTTSTTS